MQRWLIAAIGFFLAARFGMWLSALGEAQIAALWRPSGIGLLAVLRARPWGWLAVAAGSYFASLFELGPIASLAAAAIATAQAWIAAQLWRRFLPVGLSRVRDLATLTLVVALPAITPTAFALAWLLSSGGWLDAVDRPGATLAIIFADVLGVLIVMFAATGWERRPFTVAGWLHTALFLGGIALASALAEHVAAALGYLGFLLVAVMALRRDFFSIALGVLILVLAPLFWRGAAGVSAASPAAVTAFFELLAYVGVAALGTMALAMEHLQRKQLVGRLGALVAERTAKLQAEVDHSRALEEELARTAHHDSLTGLPNRALFFDRIEQALSSAKGRQVAIDTRRNIEGLALCFIDLDGFKAVNDAAGHAAGDALLIEFGRRLRERVREDDTVARVGGDEFVVLAPRAPTAEAAAELALRILATTEQSFRLGAEDYSVGASIGISLYPQHGEDASTLLANADAAMYEVKRRGKGGWFLYSGDGVVERHAAQEAGDSSGDRAEQD